MRWATVRNLGMGKEGLPVGNVEMGRESPPVGNVEMGWERLPLGMFRFRNAELRRREVMIWFRNAGMGVMRV